MSAGEDFFSVGRPVYAFMIYGGCFYHIVSGFVINKSRRGEVVSTTTTTTIPTILYTTTTPTTIYSGSKSIYTVYDRNQIGVNHRTREQYVYNII